MKAQLSQTVIHNPKKFFSLAPNCLMHVMGELLNYSATPGYAVRGLTISNNTIAGIYCTPRTVRKQISFLRDLGLIKTQRRGYTSNVTWLTDWWRRKDVQLLLPEFFDRYPKLKARVFKINLVLSMLFSVGKIDSEDKSLHYLDLKRRTAIKNGLNRSGYERRGISSIPMKQKIDKILGIRSALLKRGETELIDPYKMLGFSDNCLDDCIAAMKFAKPKYPYRFFLAKAFEYCKQNNEEPDWVTADTMREKRLSAFENEPIRPAGIKTYIKSESAEVRKSNEQIVAETKERQKRVETERLSKFPKVPQDKQLDEDRASLEVMKAQLAAQTPGSFLYGFTKQAIEGLEKRIQDLGVPLIEEIVKADGRVDIHSPGVSMIIQSQVDELNRVGWDSNEGIRIRGFLNGVGVRI